MWPMRQGAGGSVARRRLPDARVARRGLTALANSLP
jgi:hypothetical protein